MPICEFRRRKKIKLCVGDKEDVVQLQSRSVGPPALNSVDPVVAFTTFNSPWASVNTLNLSGSQQRYFDSINTNDRPTHEILVDYDPDIWQPLDSDNNFALLESGRRLRIVGAQDINEQKTTISILCTERGVDTLAGTEA